MWQTASPASTALPSGAKVASPVRTNAATVCSASSAA